VKLADVRFELEQGVGLITLDRPEAMNAFSGSMGRSLGELYRHCDENDEVRAVVLTGAGSAFCVGADMSAGKATFEKQEDEGFSAAAFEPPAWAVRKPVIAALNGHAIGLGLTMALQCDIRFIAAEGKYGIVQVRRGVVPDAYAHWTLPRLVGMERAADLLLTGRRISGIEAFEIGLASRVLPAPEVLPGALELAREIATHVAPLSAALTKKLLWESPSLTREQVGRRETDLHHVVMGRSDAAEGVSAWLERRPPVFTSKVSEDFPDWLLPEDDRET